MSVTIKTALCVFCFVASVARGLTADAFRTSFLQQCLEAGFSDLMDSVVDNAYESNKRVRHAVF